MNHFPIFFVALAIFTWSIPVTIAEVVVTAVAKSAAGVYQVDFTGPSDRLYHLQVADVPMKVNWRSPSGLKSTSEHATAYWEGESESAFIRVIKDPVPGVHVPRYENIYSNLMLFTEHVAELPFPTNPPGARIGLPSIFSNGNRGWSLLTSTNRTRMLSECDRYHEMGAMILKLDMTYPLLTPAFHQELAGQPGYEWYAGISITNYLYIYSELVQRARSLGMEIVVEHSSLIPSYTGIDPLFYYDGIRATGAMAGRERYRSERSAECLLIMQWLQPDYLSVVLEPDAQNAHFGNFPFQPLMYPEQWQSYIQLTIDGINSTFPTHDALLGAGLGTWEEGVYKDLFLDIADLDYIDFHVYPLADDHTHYLTNMIQWCDDATAAGKQVSIGEAWLYKAGTADMQEGNAFHDEVYARDLYSFWEPLDIVFVKTLSEFAIKQDLRFLAFFWPNYLFGYVDYHAGFPLAPGQTPDDLPPSERLVMADNILKTAVAAPNPYMTETGRVLKRMLPPMSPTP